MMDALGSKREYNRPHHGKTINFVAPGVEREQVRQRRGGLVYGTASHNSCHAQPGPSGRLSHTLPEQRSWERLKITKQQRDAEEDLQSHQEAKQQAKIIMAEEKKKDLELLQQYNPWGKPAPGAPRWTPSGRLVARGDAPISRQSQREGTADSATGYPQLGRPGGGAPLRSHDGHVDASMRSDPETRFQKHLRREVDNSLRYKGELVKGRVVHPQLVQQARYARRLEGQMEEAEERKRRENTGLPLNYFPFGQSSPQRDESGRLITRRQPKPHPPEDESIVDNIERVGRRGQETMAAHCTHPFTHGSKCRLRGGTDPVISDNPERIAKSLPATALQREALERQREKRREREEARARRNSHHTLWEGGYQQPLPHSLQL